MKGETRRTEIGREKIDGVKKKDVKEMDIGRIEGSRKKEKRNTWKSRETKVERRRERKGLEKEEYREE